MAPQKDIVFVRRALLLTLRIDGNEQMKVFLHQKTGDEGTAKALSKLGSALCDDST